MIVWSTSRVGEWHLAKHTREPPQSPPATETLYDLPLVDRQKKRVSGPFRVEAVLAPAVKSLDHVAQASPPASLEREEMKNAGETPALHVWRAY